MGRLEDRVAVITGAGQGIGLAYAERFLQEGAKVVVAEINEDRARSAMQHLDGKGEVELVPTDISSEQSALDCAKATKAKFGQLDILINNAALLTRMSTFPKWSLVLAAQPSADCSSEMSVGTNSTSPLPPRCVIADRARSSLISATTTLAPSWRNRSA